ncbi:MAG: NotI family restriction endonuclease [Caldilineaceae bacterium]
MPKHPLAEVFGYPPDNFSSEAVRARRLRLCPYNNRVPSCTKDKASDPLGVCTIHDGDSLAITCPVRFRQDWWIAEHAADFFFPSHLHWTTLTEVRLEDKYGKSAGNIDVVLVAYDDHARIVDFGALEVQAVYISGNIRQPFERYIKDPEQIDNLDWSKHKLFPRADYLSSSRKRLAPQLIYKGGILNSWRKKQAIALHSSFYETLPDLPRVPYQQADIAWLIYDLQHDHERQQYKLALKETVYTAFKPALDKITLAEPGELQLFVDHLQSKLDEKLDEGNPPDAPPLNELLTS